MIFSVKTKKVYINGKFLSVKTTGVQRVAQELAPRVISILKARGIESEILEMPDLLRASRFKSFLGIFWEQFILPLWVGRSMLINFCNVAPIFSMRRQIVFIHDAAVYDCPENYSFFYRAWSKSISLMIVLRRDFIFAPSKFSAERISTVLGVDRARLEVFRESGRHMCDYEKDLNIFRRLNIKKNSYILAVGSLQPGKNFPVLLKAMNYVSDSVCLVIAGGRDGLVFSSGVELSGDRYVHAGYVSDQELAALYSGAICFIQPSKYEGFGLPAAEAMALGVPVISSNTASLPEVCGEAALYFEPNDPMQLAQQINNLIFNPGLRLPLIEKAREQSDYYDWDVAAIDFVEKMLNKVCA